MQDWIETLAKEEYLLTEREFYRRVGYVNHIVNIQDIWDVADDIKIYLTHSIIQTVGFAGTPRQQKKEVYKVISKCNLRIDYDSAENYYYYRYSYNKNIINYFPELHIIKQNVIPYVHINVLRLIYLGGPRTNGAAAFYEHKIERIQKYNLYKDLYYKNSFECGICYEKNNNIERWTCTGCKLNGWCTKCNARMNKCPFCRLEWML